MLSKIIVFLFFLLPSLVGANSCYTGSFRLREAKGYKVHRQRYCTNLNRNSLISFNCRRKECKAYQSFRPIEMKKLLSPFGKPGFKLCRELGGEPKLVEFFVDKKWYKLDRCLFKQDDSFVDTDTLMAEYLKRRKKSPKK